MPSMLGRDAVPGVRFGSRRDVKSPVGDHVPFTGLDGEDAVPPKLNFVPFGTECVFGNIFPP